MVRNPDLEIYYLSPAAQAAGVKATTLRQWQDRGVLPLGDEGKAAAGTGHPRVMSFRYIVRAAITARLTEFGLGAGRAAQAAMRFSHLGEAIAFYEGEQPAPMRAPGDLFSDDATVLVVAPDPADDQVLRYQDVQAGELIANGPVLFLHVDPVVRHVEQRLAGK